MLTLALLHIVVKLFGVSQSNGMAESIFVKIGYALDLNVAVGSVGNLVSAPQSYDMTVESSVYDTLESYVNS
jgi:hypothetical protein